MATDPLSDIVSTLALRSRIYFRAELGPGFAIAVPENRQRIRFHIPSHGSCWIGFANGEATRLATGDLVLVPHGAAHVLSEHPSRTPTPLEEVVRARPVEDRVLRTGADGDVRTRLVCGHFEFDEQWVHPLIATLPPLVHLPARGARSYEWVGPMLEFAQRETEVDAPANRAIARRLADTLFVQILREARASDCGGGAPLELLEDPQLARTLAAMHADPGRDWTLQRLAREAGLSRTILVDRFRERVGTPPMRFLTDLRMQQARRLLDDPTLSVGEVGRRVGYASEAAFSRAFRDAVGEPPGRHRRSRASSRADAPERAASASPPARSSKKLGRPRNPDGDVPASIARTHRGEVPQRGVER